MILNKFHNISLAVHNSIEFFELNYGFIPFLNVYDRIINTESVKFAAPSYDLKNRVLNFSLQKTSDQTKNYYRGIVKNLSLNGFNVFNSVDTFTYGKYISMPNNDTIKTEGNFSVPVLFPYNNSNYNAYFMDLVWKLGIFYFVPFFLNINVGPKNLGGPLFVNRYTISASSSETSVQIDFVGGVNIIPPFPYADNYSDLQEIAQDNIEDQGLEVDFPGILSDPIFRHAKNYDSFIKIELFPEEISSTIYESNIGNLFPQTVIINGFNIENINLEIDNQISLAYTGNTQKKKLEDGPKFIRSKGRKVSGKLSFFNSFDLSSYISSGRNKRLLLYFGGPFYFPMKNVFFNVESINVVSDNSYTHQVSFEALLQETPHIEYYKQNHFDINFEGLLLKPTATVYTKPQDVIVTTPSPLDEGF